MKVWFQLFLGNAGLLPVYVTLNQNDVIADLMEAVKIKCGDDLQGVSSARLRVCPPGTQVPVPEGADDPTLDPGGLVVHLNWGTSSKNAFVIVILIVVIQPDIDQGATKRQKQNDEQKEASLIKIIGEKLNEYFKRLDKDQTEPLVLKTMHIYMLDPEKVPFNPTLPAFAPTLPRSDSTLPPSDPTLSAFSPTDSYWIERVQKVRFDDCKSRGILYRPEIVKAMLKAVEDAFKKGGPAGIMIKGPHGIGKSHSLVNLVCTLQYDSSCK